MSHSRLGLLALLLAVLALALRLPGLGDFMTVDEEQWMLRSGVFWDRLFHDGDPGGTFMTTHPGATTMWLTGAGIFWQEARLGFEIDTSNLSYFRVAATVPITLASASLVGLAVWLLARLRDWRVGVMAGIVLAADPYLTGMSQIAHLDALLALLMLCSLLAFFNCLREYRYVSLLLCGILAGLALGTKLLPALWLLGFFMVVLLVRVRRWSKSSFFYQVRIGGFVIGVAALTFYLLWPALWVKDDFWQSFERDVTTVVTDEHVAIEASEEPVAPATFYVRTLLGRSTPFVLILTAGMLLSGLQSWRKQRQLPLIIWFLLYAAGFLVLITFVAKKADRYALPALVMLPVLAGWGFAAAMSVWRRRAKRGTRLFWLGMKSPGFLMMVVALLLFAQVLLWSPHAIAYSNPFFDVRPLSQQGWGEGLETAAAWLNKHPLADELRVASWYPGVMRTYFDGATMSLSSREDARVGFVVLYRNMAGRAPDDIASNVLDEFAGVSPAHVVSIQGKPYAWIFNTVGPHYFSQHVGELVGEMEVGQVLPVNRDGWSAIDIVLATFSSRENTEDVVLHIRESVDSAEDIRTVTHSARDIVDGEWRRFEFEPIADSLGKTYYVALTSPESVSGNAITVRFVAEDVLPGQLVLRRRALRSGERTGDFMRAGDMAYRVIP